MLKISKRILTTWRPCKKKKKMNEAIDAARQLGLEGNESLQFIRKQQELQRAERQEAAKRPKESDKRLKKPDKRLNEPAKRLNEAAKRLNDKGSMNYKWQSS